MVHILSGERRSEFLSGSCIARFEMCLTDDVGTPTLYIKSNIIDLYFVSKSSSVSLDLLQTDGGDIVYVIGIDEKADFPFYLYSAVEIISEKTALSLVLSGAEFDVILFNDYALEIARSTGRYQGKGSAGDLLKDFVPRGPDYAGASLDEISEAVSSFSNERSTTGFSPNVIFSEFQSDARSSVISGLGNVMHVAGFSGATEVHEMLPQIVGDHTLLQFVHSPQRDVSSTKKKEFSDAIILGRNAYLSIQAKGFDFEGELPPTSRANAEKRMRKSVRKGIEQTKGSSRMARLGVSIYYKDVALEIPKNAQSMFCIFVPSLDLISGAMDAELCQLGEQLHEHGQDFVVLDPMQFLRTVQASAPAADKLGLLPDDAFFHLLQLNSQQAATERNYTRPILYRW